MGEHKLPREVFRGARDLSGIGAAAPATDTWRPPFELTSCANCFWNWRDQAVTGSPASAPVCHLMPRQMMLTSRDMLAGAQPGIQNPPAELCGGWKQRGDYEPPSEDAGA